jgi:hypothetical protein
MTKRKSEVKIWQPKKGNGYFIEVKDELTENRLAVTEEELREIVMQGKVIVMELLNN